LFYLTKTVGHHYALAGAQIGIHLDAQQLDRAFASAWTRMPRRSAINWSRQLVNLVLDEVAPALGKLDRDNFFQIAYGHFAKPGVWELYPDAPDVLRALQPRFQLAVVSNFDRRLRLILRHLNLSRLFSHIFISSELGADKPDPEIFRRALRQINLQPQEVLHVGDDPE